MFTSVNQLFTEPPATDAVMDATGLLLLPGVIDDQVHFRQPGLESKGCIATESRAAVAGGITSYMEMPNTRPATTNKALWQEKMEIAANDSWCNYSFYLGATNHNVEELIQADPLLTCGVKVFMGSSTGDLLVDKDMALKDIFGRVAIPIAVHSEDEQTILDNLEKYRATLGEAGDASLHPLIRSREACIKCTHRAIDYAEQFGGHLHLLHLSTAEEVVMVKEAKQRGVRITAEVCVHHLWFSDEDYLLKGNLIKWNPSVKKAADRAALLEGLKLGIIDVVATDHAPHELHEKMAGYFAAPSGGPMVEHSLTTMLELTNMGQCTVEQVVNWMAHMPALLFKIDRRGFIRDGYHADLVIVHPDEPWLVKGNETQYKVKWSPMENTLFRHKVHSTLVNGKIVYHRSLFFPERRSPMPLHFLRQNNPAR
jgi:dihydroorotase